MRVIRKEGRKEGRKGRKEDEEGKKIRGEGGLEGRKEGQGRM